MHKRISAHRRASVMPPVYITEQPGGSIEHYRYANLVRSRPDNKKDAGSARNGKTVFLNTPIVTHVPPVVFIPYNRLIAV